jgi:hypothetical protein
VRTIAAKPRMWLLGPWVSVLALACGPPGGAPDAPAFPVPGEPVVHVNTNRRLILQTSTRPPGIPVSSRGGVEQQQSALTDPSGTITTMVFLCANGIPASHNIVQCSVPANMVLVGGGAWAQWSSAGAMLTASYPFDAELTTWEARSKDHIVADPHILFTYAIGMQLQGVTRETLRAQIKVTTATSPVSSRPIAVATGPMNELPLGGGAKVDYTGAGNMLVWSRPGLCAGLSCTSWTAGAKDHLFDDPASITAYSITMSEEIPGFGRLFVQIEESNPIPVFEGGPGSTRLELEPGMVLTGLGADAHAFDPPQGPGRMLVRMGPASHASSNRTMIFEDKDHVELSAGGLEGLIHWMGKVP